MMGNDLLRAVYMNPIKKTIKKEKNKELKNIYL